VSVLVVPEAKSYENLSRIIAQAVFANSAGMDSVLVILVDIIGDNPRARFFLRSGSPGAPGSGITTLSQAQALELLGIDGFARAVVGEAIFPSCLWRGFCMTLSSSPIR
jgi:hypothetical protein